MKEFKNYNDLLEREKELEKNIISSKDNIYEEAEELQREIEDILHLSSISNLLKEKLKKKIKEYTGKDVELKEYIITLLLDLIYDKVSTAILSRIKEPKDADKVDWHDLTESIVNQYYLKNREIIVQIVSDFIEKKTGY